jgi:hypothetical protein
VKISPSPLYISRRPDQMQHHAACTTLIGDLRCFLAAGDDVTAARVDLLGKNQRDVAFTVF